MLGFQKVVVDPFPLLSPFQKVTDKGNFHVPKNKQKKRNYKSGCVLWHYFWPFLL